MGKGIKQRARLLTPRGVAHARASKDDRTRRFRRRAILAVAFVAVSICAQQAAQSLGRQGGSGPQAAPFLTLAPTLVSPIGAAGQFGTAVALSAQGTTAIVGAPVGGGGGAAWIYVRSGETWTRQGPPLNDLELAEPCVAAGGHEANLCRFAVSVALSGNGSIALVGLPGAHGGEGTARFYERTGTSWTAGPMLHAEGQSPTGHFGRSVALSSDGTTALVGAPLTQHGRGVAWIFTRSGGSWSPGLELSGVDEGGPQYFGRSVALSADGTTALVGVPYENRGVGTAVVFGRSGAGWAKQGPNLIPPASAGRGFFGSSTALSADGSTALIGAPITDAKIGAGYVFTRSGETWGQQGPALMPATPAGRSELGSSVALSGDGTQALLGGARNAHRAGAVWEFRSAGGAWSEAAETALTPMRGDRSQFGSSVALAADGSTALATAPDAEGETGGAWSLYPTSFTAPAISSLEPNSGPTTGGTRVKITGSGFLPGATVTIGEPATEVEVVSETEIKATTAPGQAGAREVLVADDGGVMSTGPAFTYLSTEPTAKASPEGSTPAARSGALASIESKFPPPVLGVSGNVDPVAGHIRVKLPGSHVWVSIKSLTHVPFGTIIDATHGKVTITTIGPKGTEQQISFFSGMFKLLQNKKTAQVQAVLVGGSFASCPRVHGQAKQARTASSSKHVVRKLWASGHGSYSTKGSYAAGAVVGTKWLTADRCDGTLIYVATDAVSVTNLVTHRHVLVKTHHTYLSAAP